MSEHKITYKETDIYYYTEGQRDNEAIVMLHAAFCDHQIYEEQVNDLGKDYFLIMIDMIAHGKSQLSKQNVNMGDMPDIIRMILEGLNIKSAHIVGSSLGSLIAQGFAHHYADMVKSVTVVGGYSVHKDNRHIMKAQRKEMFKWLGYILFSMQGFRRYITNVSAYTEKGKEVIMRGVSVYTRRSLRGMQGMEKIMVIKDTQVPYPLLVMSGEHDLDLAKEAGKQFGESEGNGQYICVEGAGHCVTIDQPTVFNKYFRDFVGRL